MLTPSIFKVILSSDMQDIQDIQESLANQEAKEPRVIDEIGVSVDVPADLWRRVRVAAVTEGVHVKRFVALALEERVERLTGGK